MTRWLLTFTLIAFCGSRSAYATNDSAQTFTLDGQLFQVGTSDPLIDQNASLKIQILDPTETCVLYEETQSVNTSTTNGYFTVQVGSLPGSLKRSGLDTNQTMATIFQNISAIPASSAPGKTCTASSYSPTAGDTRYFRLSVLPTGGTLDTLAPDMVLDSVPNALVAQSVQGLERSNILQVNSAGGKVLTQANLESLFSASAFANLTPVLAGNYIQSGTGGATLPTFAASPATTAAGDIWFNSTTNQLVYSDGSATHALTSSGNYVSKTGDTMTGALVNNTNAATTALAVTQSGTGNAASFMGGSVGVGTTTPAATLDVETTTTSNAISEIYGAYSVMSAQPTADISGSGRSALWLMSSVPSSNTNNVGDVRGVFSYVTVQGSGNTSGVYPVRSYGDYSGSGTAASVYGAFHGAQAGGGTVTNLYGTYLLGMSVGGNITNMYGLYVENDQYAGSVANRYGVYIKTPAGSATTSDYGIYQAGTQSNSFGGNVGIGTTTPKTALDVNGVIRVAKYSSQPFACDVAHDSSIAITSGYRQCICNGGSAAWVFTSDGTTACIW